MDHKIKEQIIIHQLILLICFVTLFFLILGVYNKLSAEKSELKQKLCQLEQFHHCEKNITKCEK